MTFDPTGFYRNPKGAAFKHLDADSELTQTFTMPATDLFTLELFAFFLRDLGIDGAVDLFNDAANGALHSAGVLESCGYPLEVSSLRTRAQRYGGFREKLIELANQWYPDEELADDPT